MPPTGNVFACDVGNDPSALVFAFDPPVQFRQPMETTERSGTLMPRTVHPPGRKIATVIPHYSKNQIKDQDTVMAARDLGLERLNHLDGYLYFALHSQLRSHIYERVTNMRCGYSSSVEVKEIRIFGGVKPQSRNGQVLGLFEAAAKSAEQFVNGCRFEAHRFDYWIERPLSRFLST